MSPAPATRHRGCAADGQRTLNGRSVPDTVAAIPEDHVIMTCVAMGYPDDDFPANGVRSDRSPNGDFVRYVGFDD